MSAFQEVSSSLRTALSFLTGLGLKAQPDEVSHSKVLGDRLLVAYASTEHDRGIRIYFSTERGAKPARFSVFLDAGGGRSIFLDDYLQTQGQKKLLALFQNAGPPKPVAEFARDFAKFLRVVLENSFLGLLRGEATDIPPFDWGPYK